MDEYYIIAGLGNPGRQYDGSRHNVGFDLIDVLAERYQIGVNESKFQGLYGKGIIEGEKVILVKPLTYMNLSGICIQEVLHYFKCDPKTDLIVISDDISLPEGMSEKTSLFLYLHCSPAASLSTAMTAGILRFIRSIAFWLHTPPMLMNTDGSVSPASLRRSSRLTASMAASHMKAISGGRSELVTYQKRSAAVFRQLWKRFAAPPYVPRISQ